MSSQSLSVPKKVLRPGSPDDVSMVQSAGNDGGPAVGYDFDTNLWMCVVDPCARMLSRENLGGTKITRLSLPSGGQNGPLGDVVYSINVNFDRRHAGKSNDFGELGVTITDYEEEHTVRGGGLLTVDTGSGDDGEQFMLRFQSCHIARKVIGIGNKPTISIFFLDVLNIGDNQLHYDAEADPPPDATAPPPPPPPLFNIAYNVV